MKKTVKILAIVIVFVLIAALLQRLLTPKYMTDLIEGSMVSQYYREYGDHDVIFAGNDEVITFSHRAYSKAVFGKGAIAAAKFMAGKPAGLYDMSDVING